ncbi:MAG: hypothetical protein PHF67_02060 [Candidatus Nanoarchaeia archaeon]|nr:hypothetical protein [Candidatus Nanoarchaeia archaeon]
MIRRPRIYKTSCDPDDGIVLSNESLPEGLEKRTVTITEAVLTGPLAGTDYNSHLSLSCTGLVSIRIPPIVGERTIGPFMIESMRVPYEEPEKLVGKNVDVYLCKEPGQACRQYVWAISRVSS